MMQRILILGALGSLALCDETRAQQFSRSIRPVTPAEAADGAPANGTVVRYYVEGLGDVARDIISVDKVLVDVGDGKLWWSAIGDPGQRNPPNPFFVPLFPQLAATSFVTTPGQTALLGTPLPGDGAYTTFGDLTIDEPPNWFLFAQLTTTSRGCVPGFSGRINWTNHSGQIVNTQFSTALEGTGCVSSGSANFDADFDDDGRVDGDDFLMWQRGETESPWNISDLSQWEEEFATHPALHATVPVPEPQSLLLVLLGMTAVAAWSRRAIVRHGRRGP